VVAVVADVVYVAVHQEPPDRGAVGDSRGGADAVGAVSPCGHGRFRTGAPGAGDDPPFCGQHKTNTTPGSGEDQHGNNTDKTVLPWAVLASLNRPGMDASSSSSPIAARISDGVPSGVSFPRAPVTRPKVRSVCR
jgi:hypothetical protein